MKHHRGVMAPGLTFVSAPETFANLAAHADFQRSRGIYRLSLPFGSCDMRVSVAANPAANPKDPSVRPVLPQEAHHLDLCLSASVRVALFPELRN